MSPLPANLSRRAPRAPWWNWSTRLLVSLLLAGAFTFSPNPRPALALPQNLVVDMVGDTAGGLCTPDTGDCTLRSAVNLANTDGSDTNITFSANFTITLVSALVLTATHTTITAPPGQVIEINANDIAQVFEIRASDSTLDGLRMYGAGGGSAIVWISGSAQRVRLANNIIGDDDPGFIGACGNSPHAHSGIYVSSTANPAGSDALALIYGNNIKCLAGSPGHGIYIAGKREVVIGANSAGQAGAAQVNYIEVNAGDAVYLSSGSTLNVIRNSALQYSGGSGLVINGGDSNQAYGNYMQGNDQHGVLLTGGAEFNSIGCPLFAGDPANVGLRNVIHQNNGSGVFITGVGTDSNLILCNWIGLNDPGTGAAGNDGSGVRIEAGASDNIIGAGPTTYNVISGNQGSGVYLTGTGTSHNLIQGNYIGTNVTGNGVVGNGDDGVTLNNGAVLNTIGGSSAAARNVIAGNLVYGVYIAGTATATNTVTFNDIGLNSATLTAPLPNGWDGIALLAGTHNNVIGGVGRSNTIAYNGRSGLYLTLGANNNDIQPNTLFSNDGSGVWLDGVGTNLNTITGTVLFFNGGDGIAESGGANFNVWHNLVMYGNDGLGIDKAASGVTNIPSPPYPVITSVNVGTGQIQGTASNNAFVEFYRAAPDAFGFGEGSYLLGSVLANGSGLWSITVAPNLPNCYTAVQTIAGVSSEFSLHTCPTVFLPEILR